MNATDCCSPPATRRRSPNRVSDAPELASIRDALARILEGHLPYPAVVVRPYGELVGANDAVELLFEGAAPELLEPPVNVLRLALHPDGLGRRVVNLAEWGRHILDSLRTHAVDDPGAELDELIAELEGYVPPLAPGPDHLGFAVPLRLRSDDGELQLITTLTSFATALDVTVSELRLEAFLPADDATAAVLQPPSGALRPGEESPRVVDEDRLDVGVGARRARAASGRSR